MKKNEVVSFIRFTGNPPSPELLDKKSDIQSEIKFDTKNKETAYWYQKNICIPFDLGGKKHNTKEVESKTMPLNQPVKKNGDH